MIKNKEKEQQILQNLYTPDARYSGQARKKQTTDDKRFLFGIDTSKLGPNLGGRVDIPIKLFPTLEEKTIKSEQILCFDIDDTLISWRKAKKHDKVVCFTDPYDNSQHYVVVHEPHVKILKDRKARGATIIVWSQSGWAWAQAVVKALGIEGYVDLVASKPVAYVDDKECQQWMGERIFLPEKSKYGKL